MNKLSLAVPASTSNLGPGFDTLGLALEWRLRARAERRSGGFETAIQCPDPGQWRKPLEQMIDRVVAAWQDASGQDPPPMALDIEGDLPIARGLGSSAAWRLIAAAAVNALAAKPLGDNAVLELVCRLEKHTDNAVPCMIGGLTASGWDGDRVRHARFAVPQRFRFACLIPEQELPTADARSLLSDRVDRQDAVFNIQRAIWLVAAISADRPDDLAGAFQDRLHQNQRQKLVPFLARVIAAAENAGAYGAFLSGSGSAVLAVTDASRAQPAAEAMARALEQEGGKGQTRILEPDNRGLEIVARD